MVIVFGQNKGGKKKMIPKQLKNPNYRFTLLQEKSKKPFQKNWTLNNYTHEDPELLQWISEGRNYGVITGFGNLVILDFDDKRTERDIVPKLPETFTIQTGSGGKHLYYSLDDTRSRKILDKRKNTLIDIQGNGKQAVGAGSTHPNGKEYTVLVDKPIAEISIQYLQTILGHLMNPKDKYQPTYEEDEIIKQIKQKISLKDVMDDYNYNTGKNPTMCKLGHGSKGGSCFSYNESEHLWHCFHCDAGGDIFNLVMKQENCNFPEAKKILADKAGVKIPETKFKTAVQKFQVDYVRFARDFIDMQPLYYDRSSIWWLWNFKNNAWELIDETDLLNELYVAAEGSNIRITQNSVKSEILTAMKMVARKREPKKAKGTWIQFRNKIIDVASGEEFEPSSEYFLTNPIPHEIGDSDATPVIDKLFEEWVGKDYVQTLYEIMAYSLLPNYPLHLIFCFIGAGCNGKSCFQRLQHRFIGAQNICSTELDVLIDSRFESTKLHKKLVCLLGETNFGEMKKTSLIKKLVGQDLIGFEYKNKLPFDDYNYAKIMINTNNLPTSEDTSEGFYRRWMIIDFPNRFKEGPDPVKTVTDEELSCLSRRCVSVLKQLLDRGKFTNQGTIRERKHKFIMSSNPLGIFLEHFTYNDTHQKVRYSELYTIYCKFLKKIKRRIISKKEFGKFLTHEGLEHRRTTYQQERGWFIDDLNIFMDWENRLKKLDDLTTLETKTTVSQLSSPCNKPNSKSSGFCSESSQPKIHHKCHLCGMTPCKEIAANGKPVCEGCSLNSQIEEERLHL